MFSLMESGVSGLLSPQRGETRDRVGESPQETDPVMLPRIGPQSETDIVVALHNNKVMFQRPKTGANRSRSFLNRKPG